MKHSNDKKVNKKNKKEPKSLKKPFYKIYCYYFNFVFNCIYRLSCFLKHIHLKHLQRKCLIILLPLYLTLIKM